VNSLWGIAGVGKSALVRDIYEDHMARYSRETQRKYSWVDVPHPFRLMEFSRRLLLGFNSKDLHAQETAAVGIMEGQDTIQACCHFLQQYVCTIVIDGLRSTHDWDSIKAAFLSEPTQSSRIIVITTEETVATHCALDKHRVHNIKGLDAKDALRLFKEVRVIKVYTQPYGIHKFLCKQKYASVPLCGSLVDNFCTNIKTLKFELYANTDH
jgi:hypothetical protein